MNSAKPYYTAYEDRYKAVYAAGAKRWGYSPADEELTKALTQWASKNKLAGKRIVEFACGEGASGIILSRLGCFYHGVDVAPSAIEKAKTTLKEYPNAKVSLLDMVNEQVPDLYDAALDVMGLHMLITDSDRLHYLQNAFSCLKSGAPMLFFRESYRTDAYEGAVASLDDWVNMYKLDLKTPERRIAIQDGREIEVYLPLLAARPKTKDGYIREMTGAGFVVDEIREMEISNNIIYSASILVHKP